MSQNKHIINNILVSGYLRDEEPIINLEIPNLVTNLISNYSKQYIVQFIGSHVSIKCNNFNQLIPKQNINNSDKYNTDCIEKILNTNDRVIDIQSGTKHTLFLTAKGKVYSVGSNSSGQLGLGENIRQIDTPTLIPFDDKIKAIACGELHSLFINKSGKLLVCGFNYCGQLGITSEQINDIYDSSDSGDDTVSIQSSGYSMDESYSDSNDIYNGNSPSPGFDSYFNTLNQLQCVFTPIYNEYFENLNVRFSNIKCGSHHSLCITTHGECYTFGYNGFGQTGNGEISEWGRGTCMPYKVDCGSEIKFKYGLCGKNYSILLTKCNKIIVFGDNTKNQCSILKQRQFETPYILCKKKK
eukprot:82062_1